MSWVRKVVISDLTGVTHTRRHGGRHVSEDGRETIEVEDGIADRVLVNVDVAVAAPVTLDQSLQRFCLKPAQSSGRLLQKKKYFLVLVLTTLGMGGGFEERWQLLDCKVKCFHCVWMAF